MMLKANLHEIKARLGYFVKRARKGEIVTVCERNKAVAELRGLPEDDYKPLRLGVLAGSVDVPDDFDAPTPAFETSFYGDATSYDKSSKS